MSSEGGQSQPLSAYTTQVIQSSLINARNTFVHFRLLSRKDLQDNFVSECEHMRVDTVNCMYCRRFCSWEVLREDEFAALKNADGASDSTPTTCRHSLYDQHYRYILNAGGRFSDSAGSVLPEIPGLVCVPRCYYYIITSSQVLNVMDEVVFSEFCHGETTSHCMIPSVVLVFLSFHSCLFLLYQTTLHVYVNSCVYWSDIYLSFLV